MNDDIKSFYDNYGIREWERLDADAYSRIMFLLHIDFIKESLKPGMKILDAGCGAGRYAIEFTNLGCNVTLLDISVEQLKIANEKVSEHGKIENITRSVEGDIRDLSAFSGNEFDMIVCYGAPLTYVMENRDGAISEFYRVLKKGGMLALSVLSKWGMLRGAAGNRYIEDYFSNPVKWHLHETIGSGNIPSFGDSGHPPRHLFESSELYSLIENNSFMEVELATAPSLICGSRRNANEISDNEGAYELLLKLEMQSYRNSGMVDSGEFLLAKGRK